ncbi:hypothetical protein [Legionella pneumophila]|uniref:hypothetical protein n=1 Tax=Legionella pneumophila TaxID=446 RepID=UPI0005C42F13|nr:hypothetical protein [Legionella pneumophila]GAN30834.1 hypothetical protein lpymt_02449 [Legionella pneumophila]
MTNHPKLQIYQGIIQYLLDSTGYDIKNIAALSNASIKSIRTIYEGIGMPANFAASEKQLVQLYQMILDLNQRTGNNLKYLVQGIHHEKSHYSKGI